MPPSFEIFFQIWNILISKKEMETMKYSQREREKNTKLSPPCEAPRDLQRCWNLHAHCLSFCQLKEYKLLGPVLEFRSGYGTPVPCGY